MNAEGRKLDMIQLRRRAAGQMRVFGDRKPNLGPALHVYDNLTVTEDGRPGTIG